MINPKMKLFHKEYTEIFKHIDGIREELNMLKDTKQQMIDEYKSGPQDIKLKKLRSCKRILSKVEGDIADRAIYLEYEVPKKIQEIDRRMQKECGLWNGYQYRKGGKR